VLEEISRQETPKEGRERQRRQGGKQGKLCVLSIQEQEECWNGFLHALLGSLHILEVGGIATRGL
jgi:hypothetical protein